MNHLAIGARGWCFAHWVQTFYPADMPEDWWLSYYANEFRAVLVPLDYLREATPDAVAQWVINGTDEFEFFVELDDSRPWAEWRDVLAPLGEQLSGLVFTAESPSMALMDQVRTRAALFMPRPPSLEIGLYANGTSVEALLGVPKGGQQLLCCVDTRQAIPAKSLRALLESLMGVPTAGLFFGGDKPVLESVRQAVQLHQLLDWT